MLGLPQSTEVKRQLPKTQIYQKFELKSSQRDAFDADVAKMEIVNFISPQTVPAISEGEEVKSIFAIEVELKRKEYDNKNIILISKLIPQKIIFILKYNEINQLAIFHSKLFTTDWLRDERNIPLTGLDLDMVWNSLVAFIGELKIEEGNNLIEQIQINEERNKILKQIALLEKQMRSISQARKQRELYSEIKNLKKKLNESDKN